MPDPDTLEGLSPEDRAAVERAAAAAEGAREQFAKASTAGLEERGRARLERLSPDVAVRQARAYLDAARRRHPLPDAVLERLTREQRDELNRERVAELEGAIDAALEVLR